MDKQMDYAKRKTDLLVLFFLTGFAFFINRHMEIKGLYMDDLYQWYCYDHYSFAEAVFTKGWTRFRALYNLVSWIQMRLIGTHVNWYVPFNILLNTGIAFMIYQMAHKFSRTAYIAVLCATIFLASHMSYYQIGQVLGLMESMAMILALGILYFLYGYLNDHDGKENNRIYIASILYVCVCFVHERYMVLLPLFILVLLFRKAKNWKLWAAPLGGFVFVQQIRLIFIGTIAPAGTGGTDVTDTVSVASVIRFALSQIAYLFGINAGPEHLNGQNFREVPLTINLLIAVADLMLILLVIAFLIRLLQSGKDIVRYLQTTLLFVFFIGACIACSSVTIRVELRWVYISFAAALLFVSWMYGVLARSAAEQGEWVRAVPFLGMFTIYVLLMLPVENYYRGLYPNYYYWTDQERYNTLAEETYGNYGVGIFGKNIFIIGNDFEMEKFTEENFFKVFDKQRRDDCVRVVHVDDIRDFGLVNDNMLVIQEDPTNNRFQDVTHAVKNIKFRPIYGVYDDGWVDERGQVQVMAGSTGQIHITLNYPRDLTGDQWLTLYVNGEPQEYINFDTNTKQVTVETQPYEAVMLRLESNFYVPNALEKRGVSRLAVLMSVTAD